MLGQREGGWWYGMIPLHHSQERSNIEKVHFFEFQIVIFLCIISLLQSTFPVFLTIHCVHKYFPTSEHLRCCGDPRSVSAEVFDKFCVSDQKEIFRPRPTLGLRNFDVLVCMQN